MKTSDIAIHRPAPQATITLNYETRTNVMLHAIRILTQTGIDVEIDNLTLTYHAPKPAAQYIAGMLERCTGHRAEIR